MIRFIYTALVRRMYRDLPHLEKHAHLQAVVDCRSEHASRTLQLVDLAEKQQGWTRQKRRKLQRAIASGKV